MSGWGISRRIARIQKWWGHFFLCWLICSLFTHYTNWSKIFKCQEIFRIKIAFCRWEKWAWQSRRFTLCRWEPRMIKTLTMTSPFLQNLMLYKMILNFLLLLWFLDMFGPRHIKIWKKETLCNTAFHLKGEASRELTVTTFIQSPAYGAITVTSTTFVITIVIIINNNTVMISSQWSLGGEAWVEAQAGTWTEASAGNLVTWVYQMWWQVLKVTSMRCASNQIPMWAGVGGGRMSAPTLVEREGKISLIHHVFVGDGGKIEPIVFKFGIA